MRQEGKGAKLWECVRGRSLPESAAGCVCGLGWHETVRCGQVTSGGKQGSTSGALPGCPGGEQLWNTRDWTKKESFIIWLSLCTKIALRWWFRASHPGHTSHAQGAAPAGCPRTKQPLGFQTKPYYHSQTKIFLLSARSLHAPGHTWTAPWLSRLSRPRTNQRCQQDQDNSVSLQKSLAHTQIF